MSLVLLSALLLTIIAGVLRSQLLTQRDLKRAEGRRASVRSLLQSLRNDLADGDSLHWNATDAASGNLLAIRQGDDVSVTYEVEAADISHPQSGEAGFTCTVRRRTGNADEHVWQIAGLNVNLSPMKESPRLLHVGIYTAGPQAGIRFRPLHAVLIAGGGE